MLRTGIVAPISTSESLVVSPGGADGSGTVATPSSAIMAPKEDLDLRSLGRVLSAKMMAMPRDGHGSCKAVLQGCLEVLRDLLEIEGPGGSLLDGTELGKVRLLFYFVFVSFLVAYQRPGQYVWYLFEY